MIYTHEEIDIISEVQIVALSTALPIVLIILKQFYEDSDQKLEETSLKLDELIVEVKNDPYLSTGNYKISDDNSINKATNCLIDRHFLEVYEGKMRLTEKGKKAANLLLGLGDK